jgi:hypothetical protein
MKKFLTIFFVSLGVIFFIILLTLAYLWFADPFEIRPLLERYQTASASNDSVVTEASSSSVELEGSKTDVVSALEPNSALSSAQSDALSTVGIDESAVANFSQSEIECFTGILGKERVDEIKAGSVPSLSEFFAAKECVH